MRAFVAVEIADAGVLDSIKKLQDEITVDAKPVETKNMHFTLLFLGEISEETASKVSEQLRTIRFSTFELSFEGVGAFPKPKFPRVIWVGIAKDGADKLVELARSVEQKLGSLGFRADKPFKPHATIFRIKNSTDVTEQLSRHAAAKLGTMMVSELKLKKSVLTPQGPIYSDLEVIRAA
ncbi:RNA 2',3'-cyclic phosphodiesterase [Candidatus Nitrosotenuis cloacae]|uniref:RNA 2',3'-cyclic phosphodiesterase n=1 Tax=Candidatus Nitrosotenuis cloacae TaxID=1603555 RepID=UPI002280791D|nr:RNA 2',3'-cyclic phosphodiesterase [Candidatus Nitrosotenuis cloacae]